MPLNKSFSQTDTDEQQSGATTTLGPDTGTDLRDELRVLLDDGVSHIHVNEPSDGSVYSWGSQLSIDLANFTNGCYITLDPSTKIEGTANAFWIDVTDSSGARVQRSFAITSTRQDGRGPFFEYTGSGDPAGFFRSTDVLNPMCNVSTEGFENTAVDSTAILFRNDTTWTEGWYAGGSHLRCDRALDFDDIDNSNPSFRDGTIGTLRAHGNDFCVRLSRNHRGLRIVNLHMFPKANNCECLVLDGNFGGAMIGGLTFDDTDGYTGDVAIATGSQFISSEAPVIYGAYLNNIDTALSTTDSVDDVWEIGATGGYVFYRRFSARDDGGPERRLYRSGQEELYDDTGTQIYSVSSGGDLDANSYSNIGVPKDTTVSAINTAINNYNYVILNPGSDATQRVTYTHDGTSQISFNGKPTEGGTNRTVVVDARGAEIEVKTEGVVDIEHTNLLQGKMFWYGGYFNGTNSDGEVAFRLTDALFNTISPEMIRACEVGCYARNVDGFCEFNRWGVGTGGIQGNGNDYTMAWVGNNGTAPGTLTMPAGSGTDSFRGQRVWIHPSPTKDGGVGLYMDHARPYASQIYTTTTGSPADQPNTGDAEITGVQIGSGNGEDCAMNGTWFWNHQEQGGTLLEINDTLTRAPDPENTVFVDGGVQTMVRNNTSYPLLHRRPVSQASDGSSTTFGGAFYADNTRLRDYSTVGPGSVNWHWEDFPLVTKRGDNEAHFQLRRNGNANGELITHGNGDMGIQPAEGTLRISGGDLNLATTDQALLFGGAGRSGNIPLQSTAPSSPSAGDWYVDDGTNTTSGNVAIRIYDGTSWADQN